MTGRSVRLMDVAASCVIVGIVAAVVAPALGADQTQTDTAKREIALQTACASNLKQLGLGFAMYVQDYDEIYPPGANWAGTGCGWAEQIFPYVKSAAVFKCPKDDSGGVSSYAYNSNLVYLEGNKFSPPQGLALSSLTAPARTVALFEVTGNHGLNKRGYLLSGDNAGADERMQESPDIHATGYQESPVDGYSPAGNGLGLGAGDLTGMGGDPSAGPTTLKYATGAMVNSSGNGRYVNGPRHRGLANFLYCDSHVKADKPDDVSAGFNNPVDDNPGGGKIAANTAATNSGSVSGTFSAQ